MIINILRKYLPSPAMAGSGKVKIPARYSANHSAPPLYLILSEIFKGYYSRKIDNLTRLKNRYTYQFSAAASR
jgi:hypothetical protein